MTSRWPFPGASATERARAVAYLLLLMLPEEDRPQVVAGVHRLGETWLGERLITWTDDQRVTGQQAADIVGVLPHEIRRWATMPHPTRPGEPLLKRAGRLQANGPQTYIVRAVLDAASTVRETRRNRHTGHDRCAAAQ